MTNPTKVMMIIQFKEIESYILD